MSPESWLTMIKELLIKLIPASGLLPREEDLWLFRAINDPARRTPLLDSIMRLLVNDYFLTTLMPLLLIVLWFQGETREQRGKNQEGVLQAILSLTLANSLLKLCNWNYFRARPFMALEGVNLLFYQSTDSSLPSNAATVGFSLATAVWLRNRRMGLTLYIVGALFGFSRIYCGVHYPSDIIAGFVLGVLSAGLVFWASKYLKLEVPISLFIRLSRRLFLA